MTASFDSYRYAINNLLYIKPEASGSIPEKRFFARGMEVEAQRASTNLAPKALGHERTGLLRATIVSSWLLGGIWIALTPMHGQSPLAQSKTEQTLKQAKSIIEDFRQEFQEIPFALNEIRAFARMRSQDFSTYDGYGERIDFVRLNKDHYLLRSFAEDQQAATLAHPPDLAASNFSSIEKNGIELDPSRYGPIFYPAEILDGVSAPDGQLFARLYTDKEFGKRRIVVTSKATNLIMISPHDHIDEFFWLPSSQSIVYTSINDPKYRDGLYLWNLLNGQFTNLITKTRLRDALNNTSQAKDQYWISLAGLSRNGSVYAFIKTRMRFHLAPDEFFTPDNLHVITEQAHGQWTLNPGQSDEWSTASFLTSSLGNPVGFLTETASTVQKNWYDLPRTGSLGLVIEKWQDYTDHFAHSPLFPYCIWYLTFFYGMSQDQTYLNQEEKQVLRAYGMELASALTKMQQAPLYLRSMAAYLYEVLGNQHPWRFSGSDLDVRIDSMEPILHH